MEGAWKGKNTTFGKTGPAEFEDGRIQKQNGNLLVKIEKTIGGNPEKQKWVVTRRKRWENKTVGNIKFKGINLNDDTKFSNSLMNIDYYINFIQ